MALGHDIGKGPRTQDVKISTDVSFKTMMLSRATYKGLREAGFLKPSPIQLHGIPLGKCGFDILLEAKSGTGKTAVFTVIALEKLDMNKGVQAVILAPTREIASQISDVITTIGSQYKGLNVAVVMGGLPVKEDKEKFNENVHIVVGSPGRLRHLIHDDIIDVSSVRLLVLDEADKLMESAFQSDINYIFSLLPKQKQVIMSSATYSEETRLFVKKYVQKAQHVCPDSTSVLLGIAHKITIVPHHSNIVKQTQHRYEELKKILNRKQFKQCLIFCNYQERVTELHRMLSRDKWPAEMLYGQQLQTDRLDALKTLQEYKCRILIATDLAGRGIDASNVDLVINFEPPSEWQTYLHRIGRAGRYGSYGTAISIINDGKEKKKFNETLGLTNFLFDFRDLWSDTPFNLNILQESFELDATHKSIPEVTKEAIESEEGLLWKLLTAELSNHKENKNIEEISSFQGLCDSYKLFGEPIIESFPELINSFKVNHGIKKVNNFEYKHVKVTKLPIDSVKFLENVDDKNIPYYTNKPKSDKLEYEKKLKYKDTTIECNINDGFVKNQNETLSTEKDDKDTTRSSRFEDNISKDSIKIKTLPIVDNAIQGYTNESDETEIESTQKTLIDAGLPIAFGNPKNSKMKLNKTVSKQKQHIRIKGKNEPQGNIELNDEKNIDPIEKAMIDAGLPLAFGKQKHNGSISKPSIHIENIVGNAKNKTCKLNDEKNIDPIEKAMIDAGLPIAFGKQKHNGSISKPSIHIENIVGNAKNKTCKLNDEKNIDPIEKAMIDAGLPIAFGKQKHNGNISKPSIHIENIVGNAKNKTCKPTSDKIFKKQLEIDHNEQADDSRLPAISRNLTFKDNSYHSIKNSKYLRAKRPDDQNKSIQLNDKKSVKNISSKIKYPSYYITNTGMSSYESDSSLDIDKEPRNVKQAASKSRNNYTNNASCSFKSNNYSCQAHNRSQVFDNWYNQLKRHMQFIQYSMYIDEIGKL